MGVNILQVIRNLGQGLTKPGVSEDGKTTTYGNQQEADQAYEAAETREQNQNVEAAKRANTNIRFEETGAGIEPRASGEQFKPKDTVERDDVGFREAAMTAPERLTTKGTILNILLGAAMGGAAGMGSRGGAGGGFQQAFNLQSNMRNQAMQHKRQAAQDHLNQQREARAQQQADMQNRRYEASEKREAAMHPLRMRATESGIAENVAQTNKILAGKPEDDTLGGSALTMVTRLRQKLAKEDDPFRKLQLQKDIDQLMADDKQLASDRRAEPVDKTTTPNYDAERRDEEDANYMLAKLRKEAMAENPKATSEQLQDAINKKLDDLVVAGDKKVKRIAHRVRSGAKSSEERTREAPDKKSNPLGSIAEKYGQTEKK